MWMLFQFSIAAAVYASDYFYHWTANPTVETNPMALPVIAIFTAWFFTALLSAIYDLARSLITKLSQPAQQASYQRIEPRFDRRERLTQRGPHRNHLV